MKVFSLNTPRSKSCSSLLQDPEINNYFISSALSCCPAAHIMIPGVNTSPYTSSQSPSAHTSTSAARRDSDMDPSASSWTPQPAITPTSPGKAEEEGWDKQQISLFAPLYKNIYTKQIGLILLCAEKSTGEERSSRARSFSRVCQLRSGCVETLFGAQKKLKTCTCICRISTFSSLTIPRSV